MTTVLRGVLGAEILECKDAGSDLQVAFRFTMRPEGGQRPVCVADLLIRYRA
jgi:hypothetical protein